MRIVFIGAVRFSGTMLEVLIRNNANVVGVCAQADSEFNSDHLDLTPVAQAAGIPVQYTPDVNSPEVERWIKALTPDVIFCFGWSRLIKRRLLSIAPLGVVGYHPTALPANRGRHPLIWAVALGLSETGSTFFFMDEGADSGDIVSQRSVPIYVADSAGDLYARIIDTASAQLVELLGRFGTGAVKGVPQNHSLATYWRKRGRADGQIDWRMSGQSILNLVRALAPPYPCAHFVRGGVDVRVWQAEIVSETHTNIEPGKVIAVSDHGVVVKSGSDAIRLLGFDPLPDIVEGEYL
jgi:methionyl-tRNA formyltransferase